MKKCTHEREACDECALDELKSRNKELEAENQELLETLVAIREAGKGLFLTLDPRAGVGEKMGLVWDLMNATIWKTEANRQMRS